MRLFVGNRQPPAYGFAWRNRESVTGFDASCSAIYARSPSASLSRRLFDDDIGAGLRLGRRADPFGMRRNLLPLHHQRQRSESRKIGNMSVVENRRASPDGDAVADDDPADFHHAIFIKMGLQRG